MKFQVLSMNIHKGFSFFNRRFTLHDLRLALHESHHDIVFLQEVVGENHQHQTERGLWPLTTQSHFLAGEKWDHHVYGRNAIYQTRHHGNAILSKFPIHFSENIPLSNYRLEQRGLLHVALSIPHSQYPLHLFNVHLDLTHFSRKKQIQKIITRANSHVPHDQPLILAGDFNDWRQQLSPSLHQHLNLKETFRSHHGRYSRSFPSFFPVLSLDRIYFRHLKLVSAEVLRDPPWSVLSDHLPLLSTFELN